MGIVLASDMCVGRHDNVPACGLGLNNEMKVTSQCTERVSQMNEFT